MRSDLSYFRRGIQGETLYQHKRTKEWGSLEWVILRDKVEEIEKEHARNTIKEIGKSRRQSAVP